MIHYTCDRCHCAIDDEASRVLVRIEVLPREVAADRPDDDIDHLSAMHELLQNELLGDASELDSDRIEEDGVNHACETIHYDLCQTCYRKFRRNPLGRDIPLGLAFSNN